MSDEELPDLEPIDLAAESRGTTAPPGAPLDPASGVAPTAGAWTPGWYADPWTAGQYRYWSGQAWTGETNRWGPAHAAPARTPDANDPWPTMSTPMASGYNPPSAAATAGGELPAVPPRGGRGLLIAGITALVVVVLLSGAIGFAIESNSHSKSSPSAATPFNPAPFIPSPTTPGSSPSTTPTTIPRSAISRDPDRHTLSSIVVRQADVAASRQVFLIPSGNLLNEPTLDLCNGTFPSERLRTARLQVVDTDANSNASLSTEAVLYRNPAATEQAFAELRKVSEACPHRPVVSPVHEDTAETVFGTAPDGSWPRTSDVERQAYSFTSTTVATANAPAATTHSVAVYLRRGRALLGLYFSTPSATQSAVAGQDSIKGIVGVFEARLAALPAAVVNRG